MSWKFLEEERESRIAAFYSVVEENCITSAKTNSNPRLIMNQ